MSNESASDLQVTFYDHYVPALRDGQYTVTISQTLLANQAQTQHDGGSPIPSALVGTTAGELSGTASSIALAEPSSMPLAAGTSLALTSPDGQNAAVVVVASPAAQGASQLAVEPHKFAADFPAGSSLIQSPQQAPVAQTFIVRGPRFALSPADVQQVFPPANGSGAYDQYLPMIVLNQPALPWERSLGGAQPCPWLALLLFTADELLAPAPPTGSAPPSPPPNSQQNPTGTASFALNTIAVATYNGEQTAGPPAGTLGPALVLADDEDPSQIFCNVIEIASATFARLVPTLADLPFLAHVRQTSTQNKAPQSGAQAGWFSCVIGNRFAVAPALAGAPPQRNIAHLVSLEGFEAYLSGDQPATPAGIQRVRLISLHSWAFTCLEDPQQNFSQLMLNLVGDGSQQSADLLLRMPLPAWATAAAPPPGAPAHALAQLQSGYAPLSYATISGEQTFAWYRGPFAPLIANRFLATTDPSAPDNPDVPLNAAEAMIYDPSTGLFDQSYAVAFQTGRSLALASLPFATNLLQWRRQAYALVDLLMEYMRSPLHASALQSAGVLDADGNLTAAGTTDLAELLGADIASNAFADYLATEFASSIAAQIGVAGGYSAQDASQQASNPPTAQPTVPADLSALMSDPLVVAWLQQLSGLEVAGGSGQQFEPSLMSGQIVDWLARLALLYDVPFNNLVPSAQMLPSESIRFFYVDQNWLDSLLDGALSVGIQSSRDSLFHQLMRDPLHRVVDAAVGEVRNTLLGISPPTAPAPAGVMAGFVLRSAVVAGWPGLEVRAWSAADSATPMKPLRLDQVAPTVLLGIFPDVPVKLEFNEPSEGLVFGVEGEGANGGVALRYLPGTQGATPDNLGQMRDPAIWLTQADIEQLQRAGPPSQTALKIAGAGGLVEALQNQFPTPAPTLGPAALAVQMIKAPEQMLFLPQNGAKQ